MSDIVERLRSPEVFIDTGGLHSPVALEAADTITRLTAEVEKLKKEIIGRQAHDRMQVREIKHLTAEVERLRAALERWLNAKNNKRAFEHHQQDNLGKEWSRLREAVDLAEDNARAALSGDKHE